jgi:hypothetical protein
LDVYLEAGTRRVFAGGLEWPGWCRSGKTEDAALEALREYAPRYADVLKGSVAFKLPAASTELDVVERLTGDATTDFGAPSIAPTSDARPVDARELARLRKMLRASWAAFDRTVEQAAGKTLTTGPRGGGRTLAKIEGHVIGAEGSYARKLAARPPPVDERRARAVADEVRDVALEALTHAVTEGLPERGPRGGTYWLPRYFVRRAAWHVLDHTWEIEDRSGALRLG